MPFTFEPLEIPGIVLVRPAVFGDARGFFEEKYQEGAFRRGGIDAHFVQDNHSFSRRGVVRGLHWQRPPRSQGKLVYVITGAIWDVAVDIRAGSPTYGKWVAEELSGENHAMLWIPPGFAHGFTVLSESSHFLYKCTDVYAPETEAGMRWDDPDLAIPWPVGTAPCTSPRDGALPFFRDIEPVRI